MAGLENKPVALNPAHIVSVYQVFEGETRIGTVNDPEDFIVKEPFDEILAALSAAGQRQERR
jgi:hypothetical protein